MSTKYTTNDIREYASRNNVSLTEASIFFEVSSLEAFIDECKSIEDIKEAMQELLKFIATYLR